MEKGQRTAPAGRQKATDEQIMECMRDGLTAAAAAHKLGIHERVYYQRKAALVRKGFSPAHDMTHVVPDGFKVKGVSTYYDADGKPRGQWVKSSEDRERMAEIMQAALDAMKEDIPREKPTPGPQHTNADLMNCYVITDYHFGQLSWGEETRSDDYDLKIAEQQLVAWFAQAIAMSPDAEVGVFAQVGDFLHYSGAGLQATTESSGHILDADGRFQKLVRVVIRVVRQVINMLLAKHKRLHLVFCEGNHDISASCWLREMLFAMYEDEPRITVDRSADPYYAFEFGSTSLFLHHGHKRKVSDISQVFAAKFRDIFGRTRHSYAHMGHLHHVDIKENSLMIVEQHRTLAAPDAHASRGGWMSGREAKVITYSRHFGEVGRITINSDMLRAKAV